MENDGLTQYMRIALSVAKRIAEGELREGEKISGRSKLSSEYSVSPETVRRAVQLLSDMRVVTVREQSGVYVLSADNARRYLHQFEDRAALLRRRQTLRQLLVQQEQLNRQVSELCRSILDDTIQPAQPADPLPNYSCRVPDGWPGAGQNLGSLHFWQATGATIVAIRRSGNCILSPGPYAELYAGDAVIFVGDAAARDAVARFFTPSPSTRSTPEQYLKKEEPHGP